MRCSSTRVSKNRERVCEETCDCKSRESLDSLEHRIKCILKRLQNEDKINSSTLLDRGQDGGMGRTGHLFRSQQFNFQDKEETKQRVETKKPETKSYVPISVRDRCRGI